MLSLKSTDTHKKCQAFLNSLDNSSKWEIVTLKFEKDVVIKGNNNSKLWDDGAPHTKYFYRDYNPITIELGAGEHTVVTYIPDEDEMGAFYIFTSTSWIKTEEQDLINFIK